MAEKNKRSNDIAEKHGDSRVHDESYLQFHTVEELRRQIFNIYGRTYIIKACKLLQDKGAISVHKNPNPKYRFDHTNYYLFHPTICNDWIDKVYPTIDKSIVSSRSSKNNQSTDNNERSSDNIVPSSNNSVRTITKTTSKITTKTTAAAKDGSVQQQHQQNDGPPFAAANDFQNLQEEPSSLLPKDVQQEVKHTAIAYSEQYTNHLNGATWQQVMAWLYQDLENPSSWLGCKGHLPMKLNAIKKAIRENRWDIPKHSKLDSLETESTQDAEEKKAIERLVWQYKEATQAINSVNQALLGAYGHDEGCLRSFQREKAGFEKELEDIAKTLKRKGVWDAAKMKYHLNVSVLGGAFCQPASQQSQYPKSDGLLQ